MIELIEKYLLGRKNEHIKSGYLFKPSLISKCPRELYYRIKFPEEIPAFDAKTLRIFENGNYLHTRYQKWLAEYGVLLGDWECSFCRKEYPQKSILYPKLPCSCGSSSYVYKEMVFIDDLYNIYGKCDGVVVYNKEYYVLELKSINSNGFKSLKTAKDDHIEQINLYFYLGGYKKGIIIYENKDNQELKQFFINRDETIINNLLEKIKIVTIALESDVPPKRECMEKSGNRYFWCDFKNKCFSNPEDLLEYNKVLNNELEDLYEKCNQISTNYLENKTIF